MTEEQKKAEQAVKLKEYQPIDPVDFEFDTFDKDNKPLKRTFRYDYKKITIEQAEGAIAVAEFKNDQAQLQVENPDQLLKSQGHRYLSHALKFLLTEVVDGKTMPFDSDKVHVVQKLLSSSTIENLKKMEEVYTDFFTVMGKKYLLSSMQKRSSKARMTLWLLTSLEKMLTTSILKSMQIDNKKLRELSTKANSNAG